MTQVALRLQTSLRADDGDEDIPFRVINQDNLPMTVIGEKIFKPFGSQNQTRKPNGIVYPTRRLDLSNQQVNQQKHLAKSNGHLDGPLKVLENGSTFKKLSVSQGNLHQITKNKSPDDFTKNLDAKLRRLQNDKKKFDATYKKPFVTTVKKGKFLEAPETSHKIPKVDEEEYKKNVATKKQLYAYVSKPMVLSRSPPQNVHRSRCEAAAIAAGLPYCRELEEDFIDGQKARKKRETVSNSTSPEKHQLKEKENTVIHSTQKFDLEVDQAIQTRAEIAERRAKARKKARLQSSRKPQDPISNLQLQKTNKLKTIEIQTDNYLQASLVKPPIIDMNTQTEPVTIEDRIGLTQTQNKETQIIPDDFIDFEDEIQSVLEVVVGKTIENALIEILEEEELAILKEQQRRFLELRAEEQKQAGEMFEQQFADRMHRANRSSVLLEHYLIQLLPTVLVELQSEGVISEKDSLRKGSFLPWLVEEVTMELGDILSTGDVLIGIVKDILNRRTEICNTMNVPEEHEEESEEREKQMVDVTRV